MDPLLAKAGRHPERHLRTRAGCTQGACSVKWNWDSLTGFVGKAEETIPLRGLLDKHPSDLLLIHSQRASCSPQENTA